MAGAVAFVLTAVGVGGGAVAALTTGIAGSLINLAAGIGLSLLSSSLLRPEIPRTRPSDGQQRIHQSRPPRWKHYGRVRVAGPVWWFETDDSTGELYIGLALNHGAVAQIVAHHIDDRTVLIDGSGNVLTDPYSNVTTKLLTRLGADTETAYSEIATAFGYQNVRGDRVATILGIFDSFLNAENQNEHYPNGYPNLRVTMDASLVWDPRDPAQIRTDRSTWGWSENPVVCLMDYLMSADGYGIAWSRFAGNIDAWMAAADICDEQVWSVADAVWERRYRIAATLLLTEKPADVLAQFLETFDGRVWQRRDGSIGISVGTFQRPTVTIDGAAVISYDMERGEDRLTAVAGVRAQYMSPDDDYREAEATPWPDGPTVAALDEDRVVNLDLLWVPSHGQARRLQAREYARRQAKWRGTIITSLAGLRAMDERHIHLAIDELGIAEDFEVDHFAIDLNDMQCQISVHSAVDIADPVVSRPDDQFSYRGHGRVLAEDSPPLHYDTVAGGDAPQPGDLVIWEIASNDNSTPGWSTPSGWTVVNNASSTTRRDISLYKVVDAGDIAAPPAPLTVTDGAAIMHWYAWRPPQTGSPASSLLDTVGFIDGNPAAVEAAAATITDPAILVSAHSSRSILEEVVADWIGANKHYSLADTKFNLPTGITMTSLVRRFTGQGANVSADMSDAGDTNHSRIYVISWS